MYNENYQKIYAMDSRESIKILDKFSFFWFFSVLRDEGRQRRVQALIQGTTTARGRSTPPGGDHEERRCICNAQPSRSGACRFRARRENQAENTLAQVWGGPGARLGPGCAGLWGWG